MHWIQKCLEDNGYKCRSYSGRGMYSQSCLGVVLEREGFFNLGVLLATNKNEYAGDLADIPAPSTDSMGRRDIIAYWPDIPYTEDDDE